MKKTVIGFIAIVLLNVLMVSCSDDTPLTTQTENATLTASLEEEQEEIFNPETFVPRAALDLTGNGLYHGVIVSADRSLHGKIWININNNGRYNATVVTDKGDKLRFRSKVSFKQQDQFYFEGPRGSFEFDVTNFNEPVASQVIVDDKEGFIQTVKDRHAQRAAVFLGTYQDFDDPAFNGTWDLITDGTPSSDDTFGFPLLTQVVVISPAGNMFVDDVFEPFDYPCFLFDGPIMPVFQASPEENEFYAQDQQVNWGGAIATYSLGQSTRANVANGIENHGFHNSDFDEVNPTIGCTALEGIIAHWTWNGRTGFASFEDAANSFVSFPSAQSRNIDMEGFYKAVPQVFK